MAAKKGIKGITHAATSVALLELQLFLGNLEDISVADWIPALHASYEYACKANVCGFRPVVQLDQIKNSSGQVICPFIQRVGTTKDTIEVIAALVLIDLKLWQHQQE